MRRFLYFTALFCLLLGDIASAQDVEYTFLVRKFGTSEYTEVQATLVFEGRFSRVWVDNRDTSRSATKTSLPKLVRALDTMIAGTAMNITPRDPNKGILQNDIEVFGDVPTVVTVEGKTDFLLTNLDPGVLGFFSPLDQTTQANSNKMNLLYIDSREGLSNMTQLLSTIAHEFQHLIHYNRYPSSSDRSHSFFNEGLSENANLINGYFDRQNAGYLANTNVDLFTMRPSGFEQELDYQRAMTFVSYLREQFGERFLYEFTGTRVDGLDRVTATLQRLGIPLTGIDVLKNFAVANLLQIHPEPAYGYQLRLGSTVSQQANPRRASVHETHTGTSFPASKNIVLEAHGTHYVQYTAPGPVRVRFAGSVDGRVMMIAVRNGQTDVIELQRETDYTLPLWAGGPYEKVTFAFVNAGNGRREVSFEMQALTASTLPLAASSASFGIDAIGVIASSSEMTARVTLGSSSHAQLELFNLRGERVRTVPVAAEAGRQSIRFDVGDLAGGGYVARLTQDNRTASTPLLVVR